MAWAVLLRAVNVGGANRCRPAQIARQLANFDVVNVGAVGTFVVREDVSDSALRAAIAGQLPFKCKIMIVPAKQILDLVRRDPFARQPSGPNIVRFISVLARRPRRRLGSDLLQTSNINHQISDDWLLKVIAIQNRFVLGLYRRQMKAITYLGRIEKLLGVPATTRSWSTMEKVVKILRDGSAACPQLGRSNSD
jgi:uncharacterized protein (DUF1697 family)